MEDWKRNIKISRSTSPWTDSWIDSDTQPPLPFQQEAAGAVMIPFPKGSLGYFPKGRNEYGTGGAR